MPLDRQAARVCLLAVAICAVAGVRVQAAGAAAELYVAMGDSFTAGPVIPGQIPDPIGCFRSDHDYPHLVARARGSVLRDRSCSGAGTRDLSFPQAVFGGANPPQLAALDRRVGVVTLQIGGNDMGFSEILGRCTALLPIGTPCRNAYASGGVDEISRRIAATVPKVRAALADVARRAPAARVFVIGYPTILPEIGPGCWPVMPIAPGDVPYLRDKETELNAMLATQAAAAGDRYVDAYRASLGHDVCQPPGVRWVEPAIPLSLAAPVHPNALGMQGIAATVLAAMAR